MNFWQLFFCFSLLLSSSFSLLLMQKEDQKRTYKEQFAPLVTPLSTTKLVNKETFWKVAREICSMWSLTILSNVRVDCHWYFVCLVLSQIVLLIWHFRAHTSAKSYRPFSHQSCRHFCMRWTLPKTQQNQVHGA